jgi:hypothetical protein
VYELAELYQGLGYAEEARPFVEQLRNLGGEWWERWQAGPGAREGLAE